MKIDLVITRHAPLVALLRERGTIDDTTPVLEHASASDVAGKHVLGVLPHHLSSKCASITEVPMSLTPADREAMQRGDMSLERTREVAGDPMTYYVSTERTWPCVAVFARAAKHAAIWSTYHERQIGPGVIELESAEGGFCLSQVDVYNDRYRTKAMMEPWSPWLDENGSAHANQSEPELFDREYFFDRALGGLTREEAVDLLDAAIRKRSRPIG